VTTRTHLTLRDRRILAGLGKPRAAVATPYVDRARIDAIVNTEHARALKRQHAAERAGASPELTMRQALHQRHRRALRAFAEALFSWTPVYIAAGALAMWVSVQPVIDAAEAARLTAEDNAARATQPIAGHTTVTLTGRPHDIARYSELIAADLKKLQRGNP